MLSVPQHQTSNFPNSNAQTCNFLILSLSYQIPAVIDGSKRPTLPANLKHAVLNILKRYSVLFYSSSSLLCGGGGKI